MNWFVAKVVYQIISGEGNHAPQFDEQLRLISATSKADAWKKANDIGEEGQYAFQNQQHQKVEWKFINVPEIYPISELKDGMELYSRIEEPGNVADYLAWLRTKSSQWNTPSPLAFLPS
ncbi:protein of unknown function [Chitinophaga costaii]|uniref:DUF4288 domain-containing protein n=1 Tax=Chitinophaga costaii TaxID=1335309 RepID=A0A1C4DAZ1_9BACT|nr:DUF4288 domain-containing protein [Chitinophaga costaii]PUZ24539.1 DUF4288 domain-containing protein [Chitinophaga costaii]SCC28476.1 protein of unknown function [Chitinophaga costaii]